MQVLGIDLGGTKLASALFDRDGNILVRDTTTLGERKGKDVGELLVDQISAYIDSSISRGSDIKAVGIAVPGISYHDTGRVWVPNIEGWEDYPLLEELEANFPGVTIVIESDRACYISGEVWKGSAENCKNAIYLAVGTGIGAGILIDGKILQGADDIAGAIGWMALERPFMDKYTKCGCFEYHASGEGIARTAREILNTENEYTGELRNIYPEEITSYDVFAAWEYHDPVADKVIRRCVEYWGMAVANLVSLFNPEKIILGGGIFGPAGKLIPAIREEAVKWAQPVSIKQVDVLASGLGGDAGIYGAGYLALNTISQIE